MQQRSWTLNSQVAEGGGKVGWLNFFFGWLVSAVEDVGQPRMTVFHDFQAVHVSHGSPIWMVLLFGVKKLQSFRNRRGKDSKHFLSWKEGNSKSVRGAEWCRFLSWIPHLRMCGRPRQGCCRGSKLPRRACHWRGFVGPRCLDSNAFRPRRVALRVARKVGLGRVLMVFDGFWGRSRTARIRFCDEKGC